MSFQEENLQAIADAIREKEGSSDPIMPIDFPDRIRALSTDGGGLPEGGAYNQALLKNSSEDGDVRWGNVTVSFNGRSGMVFPQEGDYTAGDVGAVPVERTINNIPLTSDITLDALSVGAVTQAQAESIANEKVAGLQSTVNQQVSNLSSQIQAIDTDLIGYGTTALTSGVSSLKTGKIYVQYE